MQPYVELVKKKIEKKTQSIRSTSTPSVSSSIIFLGGGISPAGRGIYPSPGVRNLDFCRCTVPTVGLYGKLGEIAAAQH